MINRLSRSAQTVRLCKRQAASTVGETKASSVPSSAAGSAYNVGVRREPEARIVNTASPLASFFQHNSAKCKTEIGEGGGLDVSERGMLALLKNRVLFFSPSVKAFCAGRRNLNPPPPPLTPPPPTLSFSPSTVARLPCSSGQVSRCGRFVSGREPLPTGRHWMRPRKSARTNSWCLSRYAPHAAIPLSRACESTRSRLFTCQGRLGRGSPP